jgi:hypothetical protein
MKLVIKKKSPPSQGCAAPRDEPGRYQVSGTLGTFMTVDPGLGGTGWAIWKRDNFHDLCEPVCSGSIDDPTRMYPTAEPFTWWERSSIICDTLQGLAQRYVSFVIYVEQPMFMETSGKGLSAARDGDLVTLSALFGMIAGRACNGNSRMFCPVQIPTWKGSMSKDVTKVRVMDKLPRWKPTTNTTHEIDAVGIGLHVKGHL